MRVLSLNWAIIGAAAAIATTSCRAGFESQTGSPRRIEIRVTVLNPSDQPIADVPLNTYAANQEQVRSPGCVTDATGRGTVAFETDSPPAVVRVRLAPPFGAVATAVPRMRELLSQWAFPIDVPVSIVAGTNVYEITMRTKHAVRASGTVVWSGRKRFEVAVQSLDHVGWVFGTDDDGQFRIQGLPKGEATRLCVSTGNLVKIVSIPASESDVTLPDLNFDAITVSEDVLATVSPLPTDSSRASGRGVSFVSEDGSSVFSFDCLVKPIADPDAPNESPLAVGTLLAHGSKFPLGRAKLPIGVFYVVPEPWVGDPVQREFMTRLLRGDNLQQAGVPKITVVGGSPVTGTFNVIAIKAAIMGNGQ